MLSTCVVSPLLLEEAVEVEVAGDVDKVHEEQEDLHPGHHGDQRGRPLRQHHMETNSESPKLNSSDYFPNITQVLGQNSQLLRIS